MATAVEPAQAPPPSWRTVLARWLACAPPTAAAPPDALAADGAVAYSACRVAARRALESRERDPIIVDDLSAALAGPRALADAAKTSAPRPRRGRRPVDRIAVRTRWFDDELVRACTLGGAPAVAVGVSVDDAAGRAAVTLAEPTAPPAGPAPRQVVVAGAGMDARAWRLPVPPGVAWFEVDAERVLRVKARALAACARAGCVPASITTQDGVAAVGGAGGGGRGSPRHRLRAAALSFVAADLGAPGWSRPLLAAGLDAAAPCVVVAEGIIMYLDGEAGAAAFLKELASIAAPGSVLLLVSVTAATAAAARARAKGQGLMAAWTFGCAKDPRPFFARCGWRTVAVDTRSDMARRYAAPGREWGYPVRPASTVPAERESLFIVAVRG